MAQNYSYFIFWSLHFFVFSLDPFFFFKKKKKKKKEKKKAFNKV